MDDETALSEFERYLRRRYPERSTAKHYLSDLRQFRKVCAKPWAEVTPQDLDAFVDYGQQQGWKPATVTRRVAALKTFFAQRWQQAQLDNLYLAQTHQCWTTNLLATEARISANPPSSKCRSCKVIATVFCP